MWISPPKKSFFHHADVDMDAFDAVEAIRELLHDGGGHLGGHQRRLHRNGDALRQLALQLLRALQEEADGPDAVFELRENLRSGSCRGRASRR